MRNDDNPRNDAHALLLFALGLVFVFSSLSKWLSVRSFALTVDAFTAFLGYDLLYGHGYRQHGMPVCQPWVAGNDFPCKNKDQKIINIGLNESIIVAIPQP